MQIQRAMQQLWYSVHNSVRRKRETLPVLIRANFRARLSVLRREGVLPAAAVVAERASIVLLGEGNAGDGEWVICPETLREGGVVHSYGIGRNLTFELELVRRFRARVRAFDPTPLSLAWVASQQLPGEIQVFPWGISDHDGELEFVLPQQHGTSFVRAGEGPRGGRDKQSVLCQVKRFGSIIELLGDEQVDILKMDIEGSEYQVVPEVLNSKCRVSQILIEFHHRWEHSDGPARTRRCVEQLFEAGYELFYCSASRLEMSFRLKR